MHKLCLALVLLGCGEEALPSSSDLSGQTPDYLCTSAACAAQPCTPGCVFDPGPCNGSTRIETDRARACPGWCGLQEMLVEGCLRYRSEDPACPTWCVSWGDAACWERTPAADYANGGAICPDHIGCFGGAPPGDLYHPCVDLGGND
jgi:hypothetical protein